MSGGAAGRSGSTDPANLFHPLTFPKPLSEMPRSSSPARMKCQGRCTEYFQPPRRVLAGGFPQRRRDLQRVPGATVQPVLIPVPIPVPMPPRPGAEPVLPGRSALGWPRAFKQN